jgi:hypothetical protein
MNIQPTVKTFMPVEDSEARPLIAGSASGSAVKALTTREMMQPVHNVAATTMAMTLLLSQHGRRIAILLARAMATADTM